MSLRKIFIILMLLCLSLEAKTKVCFIVNPISGIGKQKKIEALIEENLDLKRFDFEVHYTSGPKDAIAISRAAAKEKVPIIVAVGGDGSVNEVAQGMIGSHSMLAVIPTGSGNGFARHFNIPIHPKKAIEVLNKHRTCWVDTVKINQSSYLGVAGIGFDADVSHAFSTSTHRGVLGYLKAIFSELVSYQPKEYELIIDGTMQTKKAFLISLANTKQYGNNAYIAPHASSDDGLLDVTILKEFPPHATPKIVYDLFNKTISDSKYIETIRCQEVIIKHPLRYLHMDGEPVKFEDDVYIRVLPSSLKIVIPKKEVKKNK